MKTIVIKKRLTGTALKKHITLLMAVLLVFSFTACSKKAAVVAPVFEHGGGSLIPDDDKPLIFLSEQEAMGIIKDEAAKVGLKLESFVSDDGDTYKVEAPTFEGGHSDDEGNTYTYYKITGKAVGLEALDREKKIAVSFISAPESETSSHINNDTFYFMKMRALEAAASWALTDAPYVIGVFYDPGLDIMHGDIYQLWLGYMHGPQEQRAQKEIEFNDAANAYLEENLRAQVKDFTDWLRGAGHYLASN